VVEVLTFRSLSDDKTLRVDGAGPMRSNPGAVRGRGNVSVAAARHEDIEYNEPKCVDIFPWVGTRP
jgi:hypothetical protein